ncbi:MBL fold metallo-hydrolase [Frankia sp. CNm7]|uniref:MBL fold metallo-hydrolase n=1 Tax=Frankia nepalensis TaxID=1836974 RepID=A0A937UQ48_9ACTN|nr:MBL fold metallo-hydrolase [Frankia nepalensis]MBL7500526.1 MBL fold metallo-hydrolase [Frankia nepalensis]MBL7509780.1 MBL fold metallo-hydrolase [Frankia nepalensis]MBL7521235.1 MBL fold metallo-hydrolase [Frankia nepalensis]MBL7627900.1 MBL fold metallo-hydrolase [Frankia nepalensis]
MRLTVLGCRQGMPADGQASSSYLVSTTSARILLDCGPGAATALSSVAHPSDLDAIIISHLHADHCYDLLTVGKTLLSGRLRDPANLPTLPDAARVEWPPVPLYVPKGGRARLDILASAFPVPSFPMLDRSFDVAFDVREYEPGDTFTVGDCEISMHALNHSLPNCGTRIESPEGSLAFTGDTAYTPDLVPLAQGVDLFLSEATLELPEVTSHGHLCAAEAGRAAADAGARQLVLTHFITADETWLKARKADAERSFHGPVHLAAPGRTYEISSPGRDYR